MTEYGSLSAASPSPSSPSSGGPSGGIFSSAKKKFKVLFHSHRPPVPEGPHDSGSGGSSRAEDPVQAAVDGGHRPRMCSGSRAEEGSEARALRPWKEMFRRDGYRVPLGLRDAGRRIATNVEHLAVNYAAVVLAILFLGLLRHPISLILALLLVASLVLHTFGDEPLVLCNRTIGHRWFPIALSAGTIAFLLSLSISGVIDVLVSLLVGPALVVLHATFNKTEDHPLRDGIHRIAEALEHGMVR